MELGRGTESSVQGVEKGVYNKTSTSSVTNFIQTITLGVLDQFQQSKWPQKALKKTFQMVPKMSQDNQYSLSYQQISWQSSSY